MSRAVGTLFSLFAISIVATALMNEETVWSYVFIRLELVTRDARGAPLVVAGNPWSARNDAQQMKGVRHGWCEVARKSSGGRAYYNLRKHQA